MWRSGRKARGPGTLIGLFEAFFGWAPVPPRRVRARERSARLCGLLRAEVVAELDRRPGGAGRAGNWRRCCFPSANNAQFADGYAQVVTFGLLMAPGPRHFVWPTGSIRRPRN